MFNLGAAELILIGVVALLVLGPQRLPEMARGLGKALRDFRRKTDDIRYAVEREFYRVEAPPAVRVPDVRPAPERVGQGEPDPSPVPPPDDSTLPKGA